METPHSNMRTRSWTALLDQLSETLLRNDRRFELIQKLDREIQRSSNDPDKVFKIILEEGLKEVNADYGHIIIKTGNHLIIRHSNEKKVVGKELPIEGSLCGSVLSKMDFANVPDVKEAGIEDYYVIHPETSSEFAIAIRDFRGIKVFGILNFEWKDKTDLSNEDISFIKLLNGQLAIAMEQTKLWQGVRMISELSAQLLEYGKSREQVYDLILKQILSILDFNLGQILLVDKGDLVIVASSNPDDLNTVLDRENSVCGHYIFTEEGRHPLKINDIRKSGYWSKYYWILGKPDENPMGSEFVVPLIGSDNRTIGVINIEDPRINAFSEFDEFIIGTFGRMIASTIEASSGRETIRNYESAKDFDVIFASLGHLSITFLHSFGGGIHNAKARLSDFKRGLGNANTVLPNFGEETGMTFLDGIISDLKEIEKLIHKFRDKLNPENINKNTKRLDLIEAIESAKERALNRKKANISIDFQKDTSIEKRRSLDSLLTEQFDEILDLLVNNAIEAMPNGGKIGIFLKLNGLFTAEIYINDNGVGMDKETLEKVFDFGFTTKTTSSKRRGEGIGLWLARVYLQRFGAQLTAKSELGKGTSFIISIPIIILENVN